MYRIPGLTIAAEGLIPMQVGLQSHPWLLSKYAREKKEKTRKKDDQEVFGFEIFNTYAWGTFS